MNKDEVEALAKTIKTRLGCSLPEGMLFYIKNEKKSKKIFAYTGDFPPKLPFDWIGVHFGDMQDGEFIPSIEGAQIIGRNATKNIVELSDEDARKYFRGEDLESSNEDETVVLLKT